MLMKEIFIIKENKTKINSPSDIFKDIKDIKIDYGQENFIVFYLRSDNSMIKGDVLFKGGLNMTCVDPKIIYRNALLNNANSIIIAHNHPSGYLEPSKEDKEVYLKLKRAGEILTIGCLDSIIFNEREFYSMNNDL